MDMVDVFVFIVSSSLLMTVCTDLHCVGHYIIGGTF